MPTVANLAVSVTARTSKFNRKMKGARKSVQVFGRSVVDVGKRLVQFGALAGGAAVAGLTIATKQSFALIDATAKLSDRLGITTEALTGLQHAATIMGSSTEGVNKGLEQFVRRLGEASSRTGEMRDALLMLGLDVATLQTLGTADAFMVVADRIAQIPDVMQKAEAAYRLFGRRGVELVNTLSLTSRGIEELMNEAKLLGITFDRLAAARVENANDAMERLRKTMRGTATQIADRLAPFVGALATRLTEVAIAGDGVRTRVATAFEFVEKAIGKVLDATVLLSAEWFAFQGIILGTADITIKALGKMTTAMNESLKGWNELLKFIVTEGPKSLADPALAALGPIAKVGLELEKTADILTATSEALGEGMEDAMAKMEAALDRFRTGSAATGFADWVQRIRDWWDDISKKGLQQPKLQPIPLRNLESLRGGGAGAGARTAEFQQVALARVAIQGINTPGRPQIVRDPQLATTNDILNRIRFGLSLPGIGLTS